MLLNLSEEKLSPFRKNPAEAESLKLSMGSNVNPISLNNSSSDSRDCRVL